MIKTEKQQQLELNLKLESDLVKRLRKEKDKIDKQINTSLDKQDKYEIEIHNEKIKNSLLKKKDSEVIKMLSMGKRFKMTKNISRYKRFHCGNKWREAIVCEHPYPSNRDSQAQMYVPNWRILGYIDLQSFVEEYNNGLWEEIKEKIK